MYLSICISNVSLQIKCVFTKQTQILTHTQHHPFIQRTPFRHTHTTTAGWSLRHTHTHHYYCRLVPQTHTHTLTHTHTTTAGWSLRHTHTGHTHTHTQDTHTHTRTQDTHGCTVNVH